MNLEDDSLVIATRKQSIDDQWDSIKPSGMSSGAFSGERKMLYDLLDDDEQMGSMVGGRFQQDTARHSAHSGVVVATNKRVLFIDKGILGSTEIMEIRYQSIESVTHSTGLMMAGVHIIGRGASDYRIENIAEKDSVPVFVTFVRAQIEAAAQPNTPTATVGEPTAQQTSLDELERLASLVDRGFLSREEFDVKKKQLLGL